VNLFSGMSKAAIPVFCGWILPDVLDTSEVDSVNFPPGIKLA